jgi:hypothetical protein
MGDERILRLLAVTAVVAAVATAAVGVGIPAAVASGLAAALEGLFLAAWFWQPRELSAWPPLSLTYARALLTMRKGKGGAVVRRAIEARARVSGFSGIYVSLS